MRRCDSTRRRRSRWRALESGREIAGRYTRELVGPLTAPERETLKRLLRKLAGLGT